MDTADLNALVADLLGDHLIAFRAELERMVAAKPLPPFVPPPVWVAGRHPAGVVVRHRNGLFYARRDSLDEPPSDAWLPLLVGISSVGFRWADDRTMVLAVELSDGDVVETEREFLLPIARGFWKADEDYRPGDRVQRFGEWQAALPSKGVDPHTDKDGGRWIKLSGKQSAAAFNFRLDDDGVLYESNHAIGTIKPLVSELFGKLVRGAS